MTEHYRMADEFKLPVGQDSDGDIPVGDGFIFVSADVELEKLESVAHAVNTHDAMQDRIAALEQELKHLTSAQHGMHPVKALEQERDQLKAQNAELHKALKQFEGWHEWTDAILNKSPAACLAGIQDKAVKRFALWADSVTTDDFPDFESHQEIVDHYIAHHVTQVVEEQE